MMSLLIFLKSGRETTQSLSTISSAAELIVERADAEKEFMGLLMFKGNHPTLLEAKTAKNYLNEKELRAMGQGGIS